MNIKYILIMLYLIAVIVCFIVLAVVFQHWWIVLFSILFLNVRIQEGNQKERKDDEK